MTDTSLSALRNKIQLEIYVGNECIALSEYAIESTFRFVAFVDWLRTSRKNRIAV